MQILCLNHIRESSTNCKFTNLRLQSFLRNIQLINFYFGICTIVNQCKLYSKFGIRQIAKIKAYYLSRYFDVNVMSI